MPPIEGISRRCLLATLALCLGLVATGARAQTLWQEEEQRFRVGLKLFPAVLGAVEDLEEKRGTGGKLEIRVAYEGSDRVAREAASALRGIGRIREIPLNVQIMSAEALDADDSMLAGIFVASVDIGGKRLRLWSERHRALVFSPFAGDVEAGAVAGIHVADRILPFVNLSRAKRAELRFKPFFLKVARRYE
ncbi:hypothetical protein [Thiocapsa marina]|uniref:Uncharacterized protein n=1 Tax=Thiocapsa marina 5811 TaxID=768671 RepID=F9UBN3_9GAMM|nr:hypothetical protein [Thiocapsa marina]EGV18351.1 hypothetical protein ThimaDRAFT_2335 [Thiocapsa marina 5811]